MMNVATSRFVRTTAAIALLWSALASPLHAGVQDYEFQLVKNEAKKGDGTVVSVRLVDKRTGKPVPDAVISAKRVDMAPDGMANMAGKIEQLPSTEPGVYRFKTNLSMEGRWQLSLAAKVQGEVGTVESRLVLRVVP
jgi:YtkA-like